MLALKEPLDQTSYSGKISSQISSFRLSWAEQTAGFDIFEIRDPNEHKASLGDDADYLQLFMVMATTVYKHPQNDFTPLLMASDAGGNRLLVRPYTQSEKTEFRYAHVAFGHALKELPASAMNGKLSFFSEINLEHGSREGFENQARKITRTLQNEAKHAWETIIESKADFLKIDLYVFQMLRLYSWGFMMIGPDRDLSTGYHFVRPQPGKPRGASRR
ncbi:hypothetical protein KKI24_01545 [bacterium]|nr:hypothetical protein [bacterium]